MMPVGLMFVDNTLHHGFEDFVDNIDLSVRLGVVWGGKLMGEA
jgi:hypothetical protein